MSKGWTKLRVPSGVANRTGKVALWILERFGPPVLVMFVGYWYIDLPQQNVSLAYDIRKTTGGETNAYRILVENEGGGDVKEGEAFFLIEFNGPIADMKDTRIFPAGTKILDGDEDEVKTCIGLKVCKVLPVLGKEGRMNMIFSVASDVQIKDLPRLNHKGRWHKVRKCEGLRSELRGECPTS